MGGSGKGCYHFRRGGWRVVYVVKPNKPSTPFIDGGNSVRVLSRTPRRVGTRVNPFKLLKKWQGEQRQAAQALKATFARFADKRRTPDQPENVAYHPV